MLGLVGPFHRHADVVGLLPAQLRQLRADFAEVQARDFLVQFFRQDMHFLAVFFAVAPQFNLRQHLVGETVGHDETRMPGGAAEVDQAALGEQRDAVAVRQDDLVHLRFDVFPLVLLHRGDVYLVVKVADVAHHRLVLHAQHLFVGDDMEVAGGGDEDVGLFAGLLHAHHAVALHRRLQRADRVNFSDPHIRAEAAQRLRAAFADIAVAEHQCDLAGDHHIGGALDAVHQRFAAAV